MCQVVRAQSLSTAHAAAVDANHLVCTKPGSASHHTHLEQAELLVEQAAPSRQALPPHLLMVALSQLQAGGQGRRGMQSDCPTTFWSCSVMLWRRLVLLQMQVCSVNGTYLMEVLLLLLPPCDVLQPAQPGCRHTPLPAHGGNHVLNACIAPALLTPLRGSSNPCSRFVSQRHMVEAAAVSAVHNSSVASPRALPTTFGPGKLAAGSPLANP